MVVDWPLSVPRIPAGIVAVAPGLVPAMVVNWPPYVEAAQKRPGAFRHTRTVRPYVSKAQLLPRVPVSTSFWTT